MAEQFFSSLSGPGQQARGPVSSAFAAQMTNKFISEAVLSEVPESAKVPEEAYDPRPLYEKLAERKRIQEEEFAEKMRLANQVKRLDPDEVEFLATAQSEAEAKERAIRQADQEALDAFRNAKIVAAVPPPILASPPDEDDAEASSGPSKEGGPSLHVRPAASASAAAPKSSIDAQKSILIKGIKRKGAPDAKASLAPSQASASKPKSAPGSSKTSSSAAGRPTEPASAKRQKATTSDGVASADPAPKKQATSALAAMTAYGSSDEDDD
ncbi:hypothetical protein HK105_205036 [Polyrhizophydium stewartii]|uniref:FAM192A/Fyv6 N-terminal domain-containing protein n=1 Tax=Polyrhizophydium stewartii TaxID=2732419 RepID=A0ABR4N7E9_9FUNG|nr:hypothetical protein HK105_006022 [Polyrhizophydium stewartii]